LGFKQASWSCQLGNQSISRGEAGKPLHLATVRQLAEALGVNPADL